MDLFMEMFDSHLDQFSESLHPKHNREMVFKAGEGAGRSGSFFFFSKNGKYIIKTMTRKELDLYLGHLPKFCEHFRTHKTSILARIVGVFTINTEHLKEVHVMLMENTAQLNNPSKLTHLFDLKGSLVDRMTIGKTKPSTTLKDQNFLISCDKALLKNSQFVKFQKTDFRRLKNIVRNDVAFLESLGLMDYSLLLVIERVPRFNQDDEALNREISMLGNHKF